MSTETRPGTAPTPNEIKQKYWNIYLSNKYTNAFSDYMVSAMNDYAAQQCAPLQERIKELEMENVKLKDELLEARGLKNRDKYQDGLCRSYQKGKN
jgi:hypothetical protein